jgi:hypothetical protein
LRWDSPIQARATKVTAAFDESTEIGIPEDFDLHILIDKGEITKVSI